MVSKQRFLELLDNPRRIDPVEVHALESTLARFPYFQPLRALLLHHYKTRDLPRYRKELPVTAAHTADRGWLYRWLHIDFPEPGTKPDIPEQDEQKPSPKTVETPTPTTTEQKPAAPAPPEKLSYTAWVRYLARQSTGGATNQDPRRSKMELIDRFLATQPRIKPRKDAAFQPPPEITESIRENASLMTETLAHLYVKQKKYAKAIQAYEILMLKYPEKNRYFAARIDEIKHLSND